MSKSPIPEVHIVMDANALFTERADKLIRLELSEFIKNDFKSAGVRVYWHLPTIVKEERRTQMVVSGTKLLAAVEKLELLLGHNLAMNAEILADRVDAAIKRQIVEHGLTELTCDYNRIDWAGTVANAVSGKPPFSPTTDKGFKDAVVLESLCQLADALPVSARILLLSNDGILGTAAKERLKAFPNAKVMGDIGELKTLINALASHIDQSAVDEILAKAQLLFFEPKKLSTAYYKLKISEIINQDADLRKPLAEGYSASTKETIIRKTSFISKSGQHITFNNDIRLVLEARKLAPSPWAGAGLLGLGGLGGDFSQSSLAGLRRREINFSGTPLPLLPIAQSSQDAEPQLPDPILSGQQIYSVQWQATLGANGRLSKPKLLAVKSAPAEWSQS